MPETNLCKFDNASPCHPKDCLVSAQSCTQAPIMRDTGTETPSNLIQDLRDCALAKIQAVQKGK